MVGTIIVSWLKITCCISALHMLLNDGMVLCLFAVREHTPLPLLCCVFHFQGSLAPGLWVGLATGRYWWENDVQEEEKSCHSSLSLYIAAAASSLWFQLPATLRTQFWPLRPSLVSVPAWHPQLLAMVTPLPHVISWFLRGVAAVCCCWSLVASRSPVWSLGFFCHWWNQFLILNSFCWKT